MSHPFLIVRQAGYSTLQTRAGHSPWREMKAQAISDANTIVYRTADNFRTRSATMQNIMGSVALAYILDSSNRATYKKKIHENLLYWDDLYAELSEKEWTYYVPPASAFFYSVLALDIVHHDLTTTERATIEAKLDKVAEWYGSTSDGWPPTSSAIRGIWAVYQGDRPRIDSTKAAYKASLKNYFASSGVFYEGPGYAVARLSGTDRVQKWAFLDVLEFTGEDQTYYSDPLLRSGYEWLFSAAINPLRHRNVFADTIEGNGIAESKVPAALRAHRFSAQAGGTHRGTTRVENPEVSFFPMY